MRLLQSAPAGVLLALICMLASGSPPALARGASHAPEARGSNALPIPTAGALSSEEALPFPMARGGFLATAAASAIPITLPAAAGLDPRPRSIIGVEFIEREAAGWLFYWQPNFSTFGYRHIESRVLGHNEDHYSLQAAYNASGRGAAGDITWITHDRGGAKALSFGGSFYFRRSSKLAIAVKLRHLNRPHFMDTRLPRTIAAGLAFQPSRRLALAGDFRWQGEGGDSDMFVRYGAEFEATRGFFLGAALDSKGSLRLSMGLGSDDTQLGYGIANGNGLHQQFTFIGYEEH